MGNYNDDNRKKDFDFFKSNYKSFYKKYGHKFIAIKSQEILGAYDSVPEAIKSLSESYELGSYIIQECTNDESAYRTTIMRLIING